MIGGRSVAAAKRAGRRGDGSSRAAGRSTSSKEMFAIVRAEAEDAGRDPDAIELYSGGGRPGPKLDARIEQLAEIGVTHWSSAPPARRAAGHRPGSRQPLRLDPARLGVWARWISTSTRPSSRCCGGDGRPRRVHRRPHEQVASRPGRSPTRRRTTGSSSTATPCGACSTPSTRPTGRDHRAAAQILAPPCATPGGGRRPCTTRPGQGAGPGRRRRPPQTGAGPRWADAPTVVLVERPERLPQISDS